MARKKSPNKVGSGKKKKGNPHATTTGKKNPKVDQTNWRTQLQQRRIKFDDVQKEIYLAELRKSGLKNRAAELADVTPVTARRHSDNDPDFGESVDAAIGVYNDIVADHVQQRGQEGWLEPIYSKGIRSVDQMTDVEGRLAWRAPDGVIMHLPPETLPPEDMEPVLVPASMLKKSDRMLELEAKRTNPEYRDKQTIDLNTTETGVLVVPAELTPEAYIAKGEKLNEIADERHAATEAEKAKRKTS